MELNRNGLFDVVHVCMGYCREGGREGGSAFTSHPIPSHPLSTSIYIYEKREERVQRLQGPSKLSIDNCYAVLCYRIEQNRAEQGRTEQKRVHKERSLFYIYQRKS